MTTLFVGMAMFAAVVAAGVALTWFAVRAVLWVLFFPLMLLKGLLDLVFGLLGMAFGLVFGALGLVISFVVMLALGGIGLVALLAVVAVPLIPFLLVALLVWLGVKGTQALAAA
jgi:hypothetical protein